MTDPTVATKAKAAQQQVPKEAPAPQLPAAPTKREAWEGFRDELAKRADEIASQLPSNVSKDRFLNASIAAVKANPDILAATPRSLFAALVKAAQDGLLPDGREGIITVFRQKVYNSKPERHEMIAQWNPMFYGIRKRARELDGIIIDAQVVYAGDEFDYQLGDEPRINHKPKVRTEFADASAGVAVYAIFRHPEQGILHREVMWKPDVFAVMNQSRAKESLMWTKFWTEGWRKTVGRRASKSVPVSPQLERLIQRDDENFEFNQPRALPAPTMPTTEIFPPIPMDDGGTVEGKIEPQNITKNITAPTDEQQDDYNADDSQIAADDGKPAPEMEASKSPPADDAAKWPNANAEQRRYLARVDHELSVRDTEEEVADYLNDLGDPPDLTTRAYVHAMQAQRIKALREAGMEGQTSLFGEIQS